MTIIEDYADFRVFAKCPAGSKKNSSSLDTSCGIPRYRFALGEVLSLNIDLDVIVGNGWTRITLKEVPRFLVNAFDLIMAEGLLLDGIFRKEGNSVRLNRPEIQEVYRGLRPIPEDFTVIDVCTMIKRFLRDLKPTLLNSSELRSKLLLLATKAKNSESFELTHAEMVKLFESNVHHLAPAHIGTLGYIMRFLNRISKHDDTHRMTVDNLAVVLVGSVFGDFMGGGTESRRKGLQAKRCSQSELKAKKDDMELQVAAVKLLILNSNFISLPKCHYVSSTRLLQSSHNYIRSTSAMPNIRCSSASDNDRVFDVQPSTSENNVYKESMLQRGLIRRDSDLTHVKIMTKELNRKNEKRSSSFFPINSFRGLRDRVSNQFLKRNKSPSPERQKPRNKFFGSVNPFGYTPSSSPMRSVPLPSSSSSVGVFFQDSAEKLEVFYDEEEFPESPRSPEVAVDHPRLRNSPSITESKGGSIGSASSGRQSRSMHARHGTINSARNVAGCANDSFNTSSGLISPLGFVKKSASASNSTSSTITNRSLRRVSQSEQNSFEQRMLKRKESDEKVGDGAGKETPPSIRKKQKMDMKNGRSITRRNTTEGVICRSFRARKRVVMENQRRSTCWEVTTIAEEKENIRNSLIIDIEKGDSIHDDLNIEEESHVESSLSGLEMSYKETRLRRMAMNDRKRRGLAVNNSESMMVLNGSLFENSKKVMVDAKKEMEDTQKEGIRWRESGKVVEGLRNRNIGSINGQDVSKSVAMNMNNEAMKENVVIKVAEASPRITRSQTAHVPNMAQYMKAATSSSCYPTPPGIRIAKEQENPSKTPTGSPASGRKPQLTVNVASSSPIILQKIIPETPKTPKMVRPMSGIPLKKLDSIGVKQNGHVWVGETQTVVSSPQPPRRAVELGEQRASSAAPSLRNVPSLVTWSPSPALSPVMRRALGSAVSPLVIRSKSHLTEEKVSSKEFASALATPPRNRRVHSPTRPSNLLFSTPNNTRRVFPNVSELTASSTSSLANPTISSAAKITPRPLSAMRNHSISNFEPASPMLSRRQFSPLATASSAHNIKTPTKMEEDEEEVFKCPFLPPMKSHEGSLRGTRKTRSVDVDVTECERDRDEMARHVSASAVEESKSRPVSRLSGRFSGEGSDSEFGFGEYNNVLKTASDENNLPQSTRKSVESRPSVALLRNSNCGLVQSRINHFQGIELKSRTSMDTSTNSAFSQASVSSVERERDREKEKEKS